MSQLTKQGVRDLNNLGNSDKKEKNGRKDKTGDTDGERKQKSYHGQDDGRFCWDRTAWLAENLIAKEKQSKDKNYAESN